MEDILQEFKCDQSIEVIGAVILSYANAFPEAAKEVGWSILAKHGLEVSNVNRDQWYKLQTYLDAMNETQQTLGPAIMNRIGEQVIQDLDFPPDWKTLDTLLPGIDQGYQMQHRGGAVGSYRYVGSETEFGMHRVKVVCDNPYGCSFNRGTLEGLIKRFPPEGATDAMVRHDDSAPCRKKGGDSCTYIYTWG
jgi:hypothetical protein